MRRRKTARVRVGVNVVAAKEGEAVAMDGAARAVEAEGTAEAEVTAVAGADQGAVEMAAAGWGELDGGKTRTTDATARD
jgi:hypothetical protein